MKRFFPWLILALGLTLVASSFRPSRRAGGLDLSRFGELPVLVNGRIKPVDTVARSSLLLLQGRQRVVDADGTALTPTQWLLDVLFRPERAEGYQTFEIRNPDLLALLRLETSAGAGGKRFSFHQLERSLPELDRQARLADPVEAGLRSSFQRAVLQLRDSLVLYQRLQTSVVPPDIDKFLAAVTEWRNGSTTPAMPQLSLQLELMARSAYLRAIPPPPGASSDEWQTVGSAWQEFVSSRQLNPAATAYADIARGWRTQDPAMFNAGVATLLDLPGTAVSGQHTRSRVETIFNQAQPFYTSALLFVGALLLAAGSWVAWAQPLAQSARWLLALAFVLTTAGIAVRMWLEGRPPVTNLYSSALFVGWGAVGLCLILEKFGRNGVGSAAGGAIGFATLVIAHHLSLGGDTLEMMRAVLDSNFWLATHVVMITIGYSAMFLAGFLGLIYVLRGALTRSLDTATAGSLARMVYGIVCFATLFSLVGTVLGGIWADQSWGRFWGWDPKENGALIIVLWCAIVLHARWGGLVHQRGLMALAIAGNIVTAWSWFGVNMLGVGLHSYGFMDAGFWWLVAFMVSQLAVISLVALPLNLWRSFRPAPPPRHTRPIPHHPSTGRVEKTLQAG